MIRCRNLSKSFKVYEKKPGFLGSFRSFFHRTYQRNYAVQGFDLEVEQGEMIGLLGPNGAGKTTLMKMLTGIIHPSDGSVSILGQTPAERSHSFRMQIALVMGQKSQLWWDIPALDSFLLLKEYYQIPQAAFKKRLDDITERLQVGHLLQIHLRKLSLGERMKMELIGSLLHQPKVLFLDEPTIGLDLVAQRSIREFIRDYHKETSTTVILTSHYMADVDALCSRLVLILGGRKRFDGSIGEFSEVLGKEKYVYASFSEKVDRDHPFWASLTAEWHPEEESVELRVAEVALRQTLIEMLKLFPVVDVRCEKLPIERVMESLMRRPELINVHAPSH